MQLTLAAVRTNLNEALSDFLYVSEPRAEQSSERNAKATSTKEKNMHEQIHYSRRPSTAINGHDTTVTHQEVATSPASAIACLRWLCSVFECSQCAKAHSLLELLQLQLLLLRLFSSACRSAANIINVYANLFPLGERREWWARVIKADRSASLAGARRLEFVSAACCSLACLSLSGSSLGQLLIMSHLANVIYHRFKAPL